jgi:hypothetical protein
MGMHFFSDSAPTQPPNPNPALFKIYEAHELAHHVVLKVHYPGCIPYNGFKILVYRDSLLNLMARRLLDPHFLQKKESPIARFPADADGWADAVAFATMVDGFN